MVLFKKPLELVLIVIIVPILALMFLFYKSQPKVYNKLDYILFSRKKVMTETKTDTQQQQMLRGTAWMTASNIISRLLGALYIIPWYAWMGKQGDQANALFGQGYNIYAPFPFDFYSRDSSRNCQTGV